MKFLCEKHRELLQQFPSLAQVRWEEWISRGSASLEEDNWQMAISYFGCCYEISEMMLDDLGNSLQDGRISAMDQLMLSGHLLAESLGRSGNNPLERHYLLAVHHHLTRLLVRPERSPSRSLCKNIEISLLMLRRHCRRHGEFSGFQACLLQASQLLDQGISNAALH